MTITPVQIEGRDSSVERLQANLTTIGYGDVRVSHNPEYSVDVFFRNEGLDKNRRRAVWKAAALTFPTSYVCWNCFEANGSIPKARHCLDCRCCVEERS